MKSVSVNVYSRACYVLLQLDEDQQKVSTVLIHETPWTSIPPHVKQMAFHTTLTTADIRGNQLTSLDGLEVAIHLEILNCSCNRLRSLDACLACMPKLKELRCWDNEIETLDEIAHLEALEELDCHNNILRRLPDCSKLTKLSRIRTDENPHLRRFLEVWTPYFSDIVWFRKNTRIQHHIHIAVCILGVAKRRRAIRDVMGLVAKMYKKINAQVPF